MTNVSPPPAPPHFEVREIGRSDLFRSGMGQQGTPPYFWLCKTGEEPEVGIRWSKNLVFSTPDIIDHLIQNRHEFVRYIKVREM